MTKSSRIERTPSAPTPRGRLAASLRFGRQRASMYLAYLLGVVVSATALGGPGVVAATGLQGAWDAAHSLALGTDAEPGSTDSDTPFDEAEQTSDPSESSRGEERPEADGEKVFVDGRGFLTPAVPDILAEPVGALRPAHEVSLESQFHPDGLERPPRA